jgi:hypothetical protein
MGFVDEVQAGARMSKWILRNNLPIPRQRRLGISPGIISFGLHFRFYFSIIVNFVVCWIFDLSNMHLDLRVYFLPQLEHRLLPPYRFLVFQKSTEYAFGLTYNSKVK